MVYQCYWMFFNHKIRFRRSTISAFYLLVLLRNLVGAQQQQQDPTTLNGGSVLAMAGKECVALAVDKRFGSGPQVNTLCGS